MQHYQAGKVLDIGNVGGLKGEGNANSFHHAFCAAAQNSTVYGFDLFDPKNGAEYPNQKKGNIEDGLPYEDRFFDTIYMGELIEHLSSLKSVLSEISRVLKDGGVFILDTPNPYSIQRIAKWILAREEDLGNPTHLIFFTPASLTTLLTQHGFAVKTLSEKLSPASRFIPRWITKGFGSHLLVVAAKRNNPATN